MQALVRGHGVEAYGEARRREREAKTKVEAQTWNRVALAIAQKMDKRVGFRSFADGLANGLNRVRL